MTQVRIYNEASGRAPFEEWLSELKDVQGRARIRARLARLAAGNFGDCKPVRDGVQELRIDHGPGYRVYLSRQGTVLVLTENEGVQRLTGPITMVSEAGTKRAVVAETNAVWTTIHLTKIRGRRRTPPRAPAARIAVLPRGACPYRSR